MPHVRVTTMSYRVSRTQNGNFRARLYACRARDGPMKNERRQILVRRNPMRHEDKVVAVVACDVLAACCASRDSGTIRGLRKLTLSQVGGRFAIARLPARSRIPGWAVGSPLFSAIVQTPEELSVVAPDMAVPQGVQAERGWACLRVDGRLDFGETGILASIAEPLAGAGISIFAVSTYDTDYILVAEGELAAAHRALTTAGHVVRLA